MLGTHYGADYLLKLFEENAIKREDKKRLNVPEEYDTAVKPSVNRDSLEDSFSEIKNHASGSRKNLKSVEDKLRKVNEQIYYTGQSADGRLPSMKLLKAEKGSTENIPLLPELPERIGYGLLQCRYGLRQVTQQTNGKRERH